MGAVSRKVNLALLCEDRQHDTFLRRFLAAMTWDTRRIRPVTGPDGKRLGEQFVRSTFPMESLAYRKNRNRVAEALVVVTDGDNQGVAGRSRQLPTIAGSATSRCRRGGEKVATFVPTWNIETWLADLDGQEVDEGNADYPKLNRQRMCATCQRSCRELPQWRIEEAGTGFLGGGVPGVRRSAEVTVLARAAHLRPWRQSCVLPHAPTGNAGSVIGGWTGCIAAAPGPCGEFQAVRSRSRWTGGFNVPEFEDQGRRESRHRRSSRTARSARS